MVLIIDNYDSFTYNLVHQVGRYVDAIEVVRNDAITVKEIAQMEPAAILISPGPGRPSDAGISMEVIRQFGARVPVLGVCLGHQAIGEVFGGQVTYAPSLMHGKTSEIYHTGEDLFKGLPQGFEATRYHSLVVNPERMPDVLEVTAWTKDGIIMGLRHRSYPIWGVQFHPESVMTREGDCLIVNWLCHTNLPVRYEAVSS